MKATALLLSLFSLSAALQGAGADVSRSTPTSASSFEGILTQTQPALDGDPASGGGAVHRGAVTLTLTKRGAVSGRIRYNELLPGDGSALGMYRPVVRAFSGVLKPTNSAPLKSSLSASLGVGPNSGRQRLVLEADYSGSVPTVTVQVLDQVSANADGGLGFSSQTPSLAPIQGGEPPTGALGRFVLTTETAYLLVQNLPSGRLLWSTRMPGYSNSGSALVATSPTGAQSAALYESKTTKSPAGSAVNSLIGTLNLLRPEEPSSQWTACAGDTTFPGGLDWQSSLSSLSAPASTDAAAATPNSSFCERGLLLLAPEKSCQWVQRNGASLSSPDLAALFASGPAVLTVEDYSLTDAQGAPTLHSWNVSYSAGGLVAAGVPVAGVSPPGLSLRLANERGEITGLYGTSGTRRRSFKGVALLSEGANLSAAGWVETNDAEGPNLSTWSLQMPPPPRNCVCQRSRPRRSDSVPCRS